MSAELNVIHAPHMASAAPSGHRRIAACQMDIRLGEVVANRNSCLEAMEQAAGLHSNLLIFPECTLTGYAFSDRERAEAHAVCGDEALDPLAAACTQYGMSIIVGFLERRGEDLVNSAVIVHPSGVGPRYHKTHVPHLGADRWVRCGLAPLRPQPVQDIQTGILICYDASFPEAARTLALHGAELIALPTNWPAQAIHKAEWLPNTRAYENVVYLAAVNRVGEEGGYSFHGLSRICSPQGITLVQGPPQEAALLVADVNPALARQKRIVRGDDYWVDRFGDRRPDLYELENK